MVAARLRQGLTARLGSSERWLGRAVKGSCGAG